jgi:hypothetical protein
MQRSRRPEESQPAITACISQKQTPVAAHGLVVVVVVVVQREGEVGSRTRRGHPPYRMICPVSSIDTAVRFACFCPFEIHSFIRRRRRRRRRDFRDFMWFQGYEMPVRWFIQTRYCMSCTVIVLNYRITPP